VWIISRATGKGKDPLSLSSAASKERSIEWDESVSLLQRDYAASLVKIR